MLNSSLFLFCSLLFLFHFSQIAHFKSDLSKKNKKIYNSVKKFVVVFKKYEEK